MTLSSDQLPSALEKEQSTCSFNSISFPRPQRHPHPPDIPTLVQLPDYPTPLFLHSLQPTKTARSLSPSNDPLRGYRLHLSPLFTPSEHSIPLRKQATLRSIPGRKHPPATYANHVRRRICSRKSERSGCLATLRTVCSRTHDRTTSNIRFPVGYPHLDRLNNCCLHEFSSGFCISVSNALVIIRLSVVSPDQTSIQRYHGRGGLQNAFILNITKQRTR